MTANSSPGTQSRSRFHDEAKSSTTHPTGDARTGKSLRQKLRERLPDREYRHAYADESLNTYLASQICVLREQRKLSQEQLGALIGTTQSGVSRLENADYGGWSIKSLKKLAEAFDVRLHISFEPFGSLWRQMTECKTQMLERPSFDADPEFQVDRDADLSSSADAVLFHRTDSSVREGLLGQQITLRPRLADVIEMPSQPGTPSVPASNLEPPRRAYA